MIIRRLLALLLGGALLLALVGCSLLKGPPPPAESVAQAQAFEAEVRALPGVARASAEVRAVDAKDRSGEFLVSLTVHAEHADDLATLPDLVAGVTSPTGLPLRSSDSHSRGTGRCIRSSGELVQGGNRRGPSGAAHGRIRASE